jgi:hypothetical protein
LRQVVGLTRWIGPGRKLTQTGQLTMADARHLVGLLETGDEIDPVIGTRMFRTRSSADLPRLAFVVAWAKAAGLVPTTLRLDRLDRIIQAAMGWTNPIRRCSDFIGAPVHVHRSGPSFGGAPRGG